MVNVVYSLWNHHYSNHLWSCDYWLCSLSRQP